MKNVVLAPGRRRVGIYPGSFDPVHNGHIAFARQVVRALALDTVVFLPETKPRYKTNISPISQRMKRLSRALVAESELQAVVLDDATFTTETTLPRLRTMFKGSELYLLAGSDVVKHLPSWSHVENLCKEVSFVIALRDGDSRQEIKKILDSLGARFDILESPHPHLASSKVAGLSRAAKRLLVDFSS